MTSCGNAGGRSSPLCCWLLAAGRLIGRPAVFSAIATPLLIGWLCQSLWGFFIEGVLWTLLILAVHAGAGRLARRLLP